MTPKEAILVTADVVGLYPSIPHHMGIEALKRFLEKYNHSGFPSKMLVDLVELILKNNNITFHGKHFLQIQGTAIGTNMAPSYANIFMGIYEEDFMQTQNLQPLLWNRFIDDVFMVWTHGVDALHDFFVALNAFCPHIQFTYEWSSSKVHFLDVDVYNIDGHVETDLYIKPTDTHQFLHSSSCHPASCKKGIPFSQALRIRRICSKPEWFEKRAEELISFFVARGYSLDTLKKDIDRARSVPREDALQTKTRDRNDRIPLVVTFHPALPNLGAILSNAQHILQSHEILKDAVAKVPLVSFRRPRNLKDILVRADVKSNTEPAQIVTGTMNKCNRPRCQICNFVSEGSEFWIQNPRERFFAQGDFNCQSKNVIYVLTCTKCNMSYVGSTVNFRLRFNNHKSCLRRYPNISIDSAETNLYLHFDLPDHSLSDLRVFIIDSFDPNTPSDRKTRECRWIHRLHTLQPRGLNVDDMVLSRRSQNLL